MGIVPTVLKCITVVELFVNHITRNKIRNKNWCENLKDCISRGRWHISYSREKLYNARTSFNQDKYKFCLLNFTQKRFCRSIINGDNQYIIFKIIHYN